LISLADIHREKPIRDTGHFALEEDSELIANLIRLFLVNKNVASN